MSGIDAGRRAFLRGSLLTRSGREAEESRRQPLGPPPPWHRGLSLLDACRGCAHPCVDACETGIIRLHPAEHVLAGTPYLEFRADGCTFCGACVRACPLEIECELGHKPSIGTARLDRNTCIAWHDVICMSCSGRCDYQAITTIDQRRAAIDPERCTGCGMCLAACPVDALHID